MNEQIFNQINLEKLANITSYADTNMKNFKEITDPELAEMFDMPLEQFLKECEAGTIKCVAEIEEKIVDAFNNIPHENIVTPNVLREILERGEN